MLYFQKRDDKIVKHEQVCNEEVLAYLASRFNTITPRFMILSKSVFNNSVLAKFNEVSFLLNAAGTCVEIAFSKVDNEKMTPVIEALTKWDKFTESYKPFCVRVDKGSARSLLFESGRQERGAFKRRFESYDLEIIEMENK